MKWIVLTVLSCISLAVAVPQFGRSEDPRYSPTRGVGGRDRNPQNYGDRERYPPTSGAGDRDRYPPTSGAGDRDRYPPTSGAGDRDRYPPTSGAGDRNRYPPTSEAGDRNRYPATSGAGDRDRYPPSSVSGGRERYPEFDYITFYEQPNFRGWSFQAPLSSKCRNLENDFNSYNNGISSIKTNGNCVVVFTRYGCRGREFRVQPRYENQQHGQNKNRNRPIGHTELAEDINNMISSYRTC